MREAEKRIKDAIRANSRTLDLSSLNLDNLPESVWQLTELEYLNVRSNQLTKLPESLDRLGHLQHIDVSGNGLTNLPDALGNLTQLRYLDASNNQVWAWPTHVSKLHLLLHLDISSNRLDSWPKYLSTLSRLEHLDIGNNELPPLPETIGNLTNLSFLDISNNRMSNLPRSLGQLPKLQHLVINGNRLAPLPEFLADCRSLIGLHVSGNELLRLPDWLGELGALQYFSAASNALTALPDQLGNLRDLKLLSLSDNPLTKLPDSMILLTKLQGLMLAMDVSVLLWSDNRRTWTDYVRQRQGMLKALPVVLKELPLLRELYLHGQPELGLPPEVLGPSWTKVQERGGKATNSATVLDYYFRTHGADALQRPLNEAKMILVGRGGVGKTSLVNRLVTGRYNPKETKTEGIFITPWRLQIRSDPVKLNIWDFGGQEIMHSTHQFFLTKRSLYLLVLNAREGEQDSNIEYWLRLIESFGQIRL